MKSSMPASRQRARSSSSALAVIATAVGTRCQRTSPGANAARRLRLVDDRRLHVSIRSRSEWCPPQAATAWPAVSRATVSSFGAAGCGDSTRKIRPRPGVLSSVIVSCISAPGRHRMNRPSHVPPSARVIDESACESGMHAGACCRSRTASGSRGRPASESGGHAGCAALKIDKRHRSSTDFATGQALRNAVGGAHVSGGDAGRGELIRRTPRRVTSDDGPGRATALPARPPDRSAATGDAHQRAAVRSDIRS